MTRPRWLGLPAMRYPDEYVWFVLFSSMDIMLTWVILNIDGQEANPIAAIVIEAWGLLGAIVFKFSLMLVVVLACEIVGRSRPRAARALAIIAVLVSAMTVFYAIALLAMHIVLDV